MHLFIASLLLLLGISFWKISFLKISPIISEVPSEKILKMIHMIHQNMSGFSKVSFIFLAQLVNINIILGICEWCSKIIRYALQKTMANDESSLNPWTPFIYMIALFTILYFFGATIVMAAWMIVSVPAVYFAQLIGAL